ncbi:hypothetical protein DYD21_10215 [Rhodohalobacter sp. SW132]|uniref:alginate lyase family protein n=1 Tax=Rhodohalobacter sp. SW132 TaxID=2293433 RepID=UPI000E240754|nr:alginate lyase family protein [Rhodohalobacter sp. SW132]REL33771.1 hypothetical protein DYD21_10215 [Rhodohalobacter sp. SW132]
MNIFTISPAYLFILSILGIVFVVNDNNKDRQESPAAAWQDITTTEDVWNQYPGKIHTIFSSLNIDYPGLEPVKTALENSDTLSAANLLLDYYRSGESAKWLREKSYEYSDPDDQEQAENVLQNKITRTGATVEIPTTDGGGWDWNYTGPDQDDEFGYNLNRHRYFFHLLNGWHETENAEYAEKFDQIVRDWILNNPLTEKGDRFWEVHRTTTQELDWRDIGEVIWRDIDAGIRMGESWPQAFFGFQQADEFTPAARLLMIHSFIIHADYLQEYHQVHHNWATMEMNGLSYIGLTFPEFQQSEEWIDYALEVMEAEINGGQVYPDGVQMELATNTHWVALSRFENLVENFREASRAVPDSYLQHIEGMYDYLAYSMRPDGFQPLNNDSDREDLRPRVLRASENYDRSDWKFIATNGEEGVEPDGLPSRVFPWAGLHVMRNGWDRMSHWAFFKTGPYGIGHQHRDKLHLSVHAYGRDLLVDSGRFTHEDYFSFDPTVWRGYFRSTFSQNAILVDGAGQDVWERIAEEPHEEGRDYINTGELDFARGTFSDGYEGIEGQADHTRAVVYVKDRYWVVVDRLTTDRPREIQTLWRYAPDANAVIEELQVVSNDQGKGNIRVVPSGDIHWELEIIEGQTEPYYQGWYSRTYGEKEPNPTAIYSANIEGDSVFAWILVPADGLVPEVQSTIVNEDNVDVEIQVAGEQPVVVTVPLDDGLPEINNLN